MAAISLLLSREAPVSSNEQHREVIGTQPLADGGRDAASPEILYGALLALGARAVKMGLRAAGKGAGLAGGMAARAARSSPLQSRIHRLSEEWDEDQRVLLETFDRTITNVIEIVLDRIDLTQLVIERVDVDKIIEKRVNIDTVIERADVIGVARDVVQQLDLPEIIRESSSTMGMETMEGLRVRGMDADRSLSRLVDKILNRSNGPETGEANLRTSPGSSS
jgi:hypothetical protein